MGNKKKNKRNNKGMSSQAQSPPTALSQSTQPDPNLCTTDLLGQSRDILYGQEGSMQNLQNFTHDQGNFTIGNVTQPNTHLLTSAQMNPLPTNQSNSSQYMPSHDMSNGANNGANSCVPPWAANMCRQLQNIQVQLETQNKRWQVVENQLQSQNARMTNIEAQITQLGHLSQKVNETTKKVDSINTVINSMKTKFSGYEESVNYYNDICDTILSSNTEIDTRLRDLTNKLSSVEQKQKASDDKLMDVQWRSMRENLIFSGNPETELRRGEQENCESLVKEFIRNQMRIEREIEFDRVHRLGRYMQNQRYPRPIIAKFTYFKDKEHVRQAAPRTLIGTRYSVNEQFPPEMESRRKELYPVAKDARRIETNRVRLVRDKLYINGAQYIPNTAPNAAPERQINMRDSRSQRTNNNTIHSQQTNGRNVSNRNETPLLIGQQYSRRRPNTQNTQFGQERSSGVNTSTVRAPGNAHMQNDTSYSPERNTFTSNKFIVLGEETTDSQLLTPSCAGKKKASSPLDSDLTLKKQREYTSFDSTNGECEIEQTECNDSVCSPGSEEMISDA